MEMQYMLLTNQITGNGQLLTGQMLVGQLLVGHLLAKLLQCVYRIKTQR
jgi:hypothetical protein